MLTSRGDQVLAIDDLSSGKERMDLLKSWGVETEVGDIRSLETNSVITAFQPDVICHLAAQIDVRKSVEDPVLDADINILGLLRVLEAAKRAEARVVFASSGGTIYGEVDPANLPVSEEAQGRPVAPYGISKKVADDYLHFYRNTFGVRFVSLALANVYGPRQDPHGEAGVVAIFASKLLAGEPCVIYGDGEQTRDFVFVGDVADAFLSAIESGDGETINVGTSNETSVVELYRILAEAADESRRAKHEPERPGELRRSALSIEKAQRVLGWAPKTKLHEGLTTTLDSFRA